MEIDVAGSLAAHESFVRAPPPSPAIDGAERIAAALIERLE